MKPCASAGCRLKGKYRKSAGQRGFTLTEIAIVLGIIGLIIAAIWGAASVARYRVQLNQATDELGAIVTNMRSLYSGQNSSAAAAIAFPGAILVRQGVFPQDMLVPVPPTGTIPIAGTFANNPWDQTTANGSAQLQVAPGQFTIRFIKVPADSCIDLLVKTSLSPTDTGVRQIQVNGVTVGQSNLSPPTLPITPTAAALACPVGALFTIDWFYGLGS